MSETWTEDWDQLLANRWWVYRDNKWIEIPPETPPSKGETYYILNADKHPLDLFGDEPPK